MRCVQPGASVNVERLKSKWRKQQVRVHASQADLRSDRPPPQGSFCERCEVLTPDITCIYGNYWVCPACTAFHAGLVDYTRRIQEFRSPRENVAYTSAEEADGSRENASGRKCFRA